MNLNQPHRIELPTIYGMQTVNAYLFLKPEPVLIDCGEGGEQSWEALTSALSQYGLKAGDIAKVIITHAHVDHMGGLAEFCRNSDAEVWVSDLVYDWAVNVEEMRRQRVDVIDRAILDLHSDPQSQLRQMLMAVYKGFGNNWTSVPEGRVRRFGLNEDLNMGGRTWQTLYMPGHSSTQSCFFDQGSGELLSSDMLIRITPTPVIEANPTPPYQRIPSLPQMLDSYEKIRQLKIQTVYPGHYESFGAAHDLIDKQVSRIHVRKEQCLDLIRGGTGDFMTLLQQMYGKRMTLPAVPMLLGYLDLLMAEDKIYSTETKAGRRFFST